MICQCKRPGFAVDDTYCFKCHLPSLKGIKSIMKEETKSKFKNLKVGEKMTISFAEFGGRPEGPATVGEGTRRVWKMTPTDEGLVVERIK